jgi:hypothetical protein
VAGSLTGRAHPVALYDPLRHELLVYGGEDASTPLADAAALSLNAPCTWRPLSPPTTPLARSQAAAVFDPIGDRAVIFGGFDSDFTDLNYANGESLALVSESPGAWTDLLPSNSPPLSRGMRSVLDTPNRRMVFWSGDDTESTAPYHRGLWALQLDDPTSWTLLLATSPMPGRIHAAVVYDALHQRMVVVGGEDETAVATDTVEWIGL